MTKKIASIVLALGLSGPPATAQDAGSDLMRRGMELFLEGLQDELSPALREFYDLAEEAGPAFSSFLQQMGPAFGEILNQVQDWTAYHPPEILPNGDIILRRKQPSDITPEDTPPSETPADPPKDGQIDL